MNTLKNSQKVKSHISGRESVAMSNGTRKELKAVSKLFRGQEMFPEKVERAKQMFKGLVAFSD